MEPVDPAVRLPNLTQNAEARGIRQAQIEQQQIVRTELTVTERSGRGRCGQHLEAIGRQVIAEEVEGGPVVFTEDQLGDWGSIGQRRKLGAGRPTLSPLSGHQFQHVARTAAAKETAGWCRGICGQNLVVVAEEEDIDREQHSDGVNRTATRDQQAVSGQ